MRLLLCIFLPFLAFFTIGRPIAGLFCLILQVTLIGWLPGALWAILALGQWNTDQKIKGALKASKASHASAVQAAASVPAPTKVGVHHEHESS